MAGTKIVTRRADKFGVDDSIVSVSLGSCNIATGRI